MSVPGRHVFTMSPSDVALLGGVPPSEGDIDQVNANAEAMGFTLAWTRSVVPTGMAWVLHVDTPRGRFTLSASTEESWHEALRNVGLVDG